MENQKKEWKKIELKKIDINLYTNNSAVGPFYDGFAFS